MKSLHIAYGSNTYLRDRDCRESLFKARKLGFEVVEVAGDDAIGLSAQLSGVTGLFGSGKPQKKALFIDDTEPKLLLAPIKKCLDDEDSNTFVIIKGPEKLKAKSALAQLVLENPKSCKEFVAPPPYRADEEAVKFCVHEAKLHDKVLSEKVAGALVQAVGSDLGMLSFEILKFSLYLDSLGDTKEITPVHIRKAMAPMAEVSVFPLASALAEKDAKAIAVLLRRIEDTHGDEPGGLTIKVCRMISSTVTNWMAVIHLSESGVGSKEAAEQMGVNPYRYEKFLLPEAKKAGKVWLRKILSILAESEKGVRRGDLNPWIGFQMRIFRLLQKKP